MALERDFFYDSSFRADAADFTYCYGRWTTSVSVDYSGILPNDHDKWLRLTETHPVLNDAKCSWAIIIADKQILPVNFVTNNK